MLPAIGSASLTDRQGKIRLVAKKAHIALRRIGPADRCRVFECLRKRKIVVCSLDCLHIVSLCGFDHCMKALGPDAAVRTKKIGLWSVVLATIEVQQLLEMSNGVATFTTEEIDISEHAVRLTEVTLAIFLQSKCHEPASRSLGQIEFCGKVISGEDAVENLGHRLAVIDDIDQRLRHCIGLDRVRMRGPLCNVTGLCQSELDIQFE